MADGFPAAAAIRRAQKHQGRFRGIHRRGAQPDFRTANGDMVGQKLAADFQHAIFVAHGSAAASDGFHARIRFRATRLRGSAPKGQ